MQLHAPPPPIRLVLADDHDLVRSGLSALLSHADNIEVVAQARDGQELVRMADQFNPDVVLTDVSMPVMDGLAATRALRARHPQLRILMLSMHDKPDVMREAMACGANGYLLKDTSPAELEIAVRRVVQSGCYYTSAVSMKLLQPAERRVADDLTSRQIEILTLLARGQASKEIAYRLGLSPKTVDVHRSRITARLGIGGIAELTLYALRQGLVEV